MTAPSCDYIVLGGGLSGLAFALEAARLGKRVTLFESQDEVGGLSRTLVYGEYRFDIGGHRFHSQWPEVTDWVRDLMDGDLLDVPRYSRIHLGERYVDYPIQFPNALTALGPTKALRVAASYLGACLSRNGHEDQSFEGWVSHRFGRALYDIYFRPYTEKVWGIRCTELSSDWASERIQLPSLGAAVKNSLLRSGRSLPTLVSRFLYPPLGIGMIPQRIAEKATATGRVTIHCNSPVHRLSQDAPEGTWRVHYRQGGRELAAEGKRVVSTIPLTALWRMLPASAPAPDLDGKLSYRGLACVFMAIDTPQVSADTWTYFPEAHIRFGRTHEPRNWSVSMAPSGKTSLCAEVFCSEGDDIWRRTDGQLIDEVASGLAQLGLIPREQLCDAWVLRVPHAYPRYGIGYAAELQRASDYISRRWPTLHLLGRTGTFQYLNMDAVIRQAVQAAGALCRL